jgi:hypothetical protein
LLARFARMEEVREEPAPAEKAGGALAAPALARPHPAL